MTAIINDVDVVEGLGEANYGGNKIVNARLKDGANGPFRLFPPIHVNKDTGRWSFYSKLHWGFTIEKNGKTIPMPFECPEETDRETKKVTIPCAQCNVSRKRKEELVELLATLKKEGKSSAQISALSKPLVDYSKAYNLDKKHVIYAMNERQELVKLQIPHKSKQALDVEISKLAKKKIDPLKPSQGAWFVFTRTGNGMDTLHQVEVVKEETADGGEKVKLAPLTPAIISRLLKDFPKDITKTSRRISSDQVKQLVSCKTPEEVEAVFNQSQTVEDAVDDGADEEMDSEPMFSANTKPSASVEDADFAAMFTPKAS
jgi:hypothetical protein